MSYLTEENARTSICIAGRDDVGAPHPENNKDHRRYCRGSECKMGWRRLWGVSKDGPQQMNVGYCGLAGVPGPYSQAGHGTGKRP